ncbi:exodeoxyribonuclease VII small subunit [Hymenobacter caeli]|uniref:Exodeoxyribonuclease VII small subunit n=1 Tax=Hymenobacter caeli TaxID=2735894 RepID=A0ABX2FLQ5_9BACT|nr:exodeoxyribonuclease VII small subunit [Hymenobacter caeli]NRT17417.1 exodeoxyribonuclease VII small subunit [Hymenobacter caeli]
MPPAPVTYAQALAELETILRALETDTVDVDDLTARVERSAELIRLCRHKLRHAEASLDRVFDSLDEDDAEPEDEPEADEDGDEDEEEDEDDHDEAGGAGKPNQPSWLF